MYYVDRAVFSWKAGDYTKTSKNMIFVLSKGGLISEGILTLVPLPTKSAKFSERPKQIFWFRSDTETETHFGRYFWPIL